MPTTETKSDLAQHVSVQHAPKNFKCEDCDFATTKPYYLKRHRTDKHSGMIFKCDMCSSTFISDFNLRAHKISQHTARTLKCDHCDRMYPSKALLKAHFREAHLVDEIPCDICGKVYGNKSKLQSHKRMAHHASGAQVSTSGDLRFTGFKKEWQCPECDFVVVRSNELMIRAGIKSHKEMHEQRKRWQCEFCSKQFRAHHSWQAHMNTHQGVYPFECVPCNKKYPSRSLLAQHFHRSTAHRDNRDLKHLFDTAANNTEQQQQLLQD